VFVEVVEMVRIDEVELGQRHVREAEQRLPSPMRTWARRHLFNVVQAFDIGIAAIKDPQRAVDESEHRREAMRRTFDECLAMRRPYEDDR